MLWLDGGMEEAWTGGDRKSNLFTHKFSNCSFCWCQFKCKCFVWFPIARLHWFRDRFLCFFFRFAISEFIVNFPAFSFLQRRRETQHYTVLKKVSKQLNCQWPMIAKCAKFLREFSSEKLIAARLVTLVREIPYFWLFFSLFSRWWCKNDWMLLLICER